MCVAIPAAVAWVATAVSVASAGVSAYAAVSQGEAAKEAADYNANIQRKQAVQAQNVAADQAAQQKEKARRIASTQVAMGAAGGLETTTGTMGDIISETKKYSELDALRITNNAARSAWGLREQAGLEEWKGGQAQTAGYIGATSSILGGMSNAYFGAAKFNQKAA